MREFAYRRPGDEAEVLALAADPKTNLIAGGTELLNWMRLGISDPAEVVDVGDLPGFDQIALEGGTLRIGALATLNEVGEHPLVREHARVLAEACLLAASAQLRNRATLGGNVLQRTRCAYFRAEEPLPWACNKRQEGSGCAALPGINSDQAIFGWTEACVATHPSDPLVALACLDATVDLASTGATREMPVAELHLSQEEAAEEGQDSARYENRLHPGELIRGYRIPIRDSERSSYIKVRDRQSYAYALVTAAAAIEVEEGSVVAARIALGSVAQRPWRLRGAEATLVGGAAREAEFSAAVAADLSQARALSGNGYKVRLARNAAVRALVTAVA